MNNGAFGENFPYTNFHDLNMDWIIKIAKDFLDQYTNIQQVIADGLQSLEDTTQNGLDSLTEKTDNSLQALQNKKEELEALLDQWYTTHSQELADQLADALEDIQTTLTTAISTFNTSADTKVAQVLEQIPDDYTEMGIEVDRLVKDYTDNYLGIGNINETIENLHFSRQLGAYAVRNGNVVAVTSSYPTEEKWGWTIVQNNYIEVFNENVEYVILGINGKYAIGVALSGSQRGKIVCFEGYSGHANFLTDTDMFTGTSYYIGNVIQIRNNEDKTFTIKINDTSYTVDLRNTNINVWGFDEPIETPVIGFAISGLTGSYNITIPPYPEKMSDTDRLAIMNNAQLPHITDDELIKVGTTATIDGSTVTIASVTSGVWNACAIKPVRELTISGCEYLVLALGKAIGKDFAYAVCLNETNYGKIFVFTLNETDFGVKTGNVLNSTYEPTMTVKVSQASPHSVKITQNGVSTIVDILANPQIIWDRIAFGNCLQGDRQFMVYNPPWNTLGKVWSGKHWFAFGDSITEMGYYLGNVISVLGVQAHKYGYGGYTYSQLANVYTDMFNSVTPSLITIWAGTNDFGHSNPIEDMVSGMETIIQGLYTEFPNVQLVIIVPCQRNFDATGIPTETSGLGPNSLGKYLIDYVKAIRETAEKYGVPVIDLYKESGINVYNASSKTSDGLHPTFTFATYLGYHIAKCIEQFRPVIV